MGLFEFLSLAPVVMPPKKGAKVDPKKASKMPGKGKLGTAAGKSGGKAKKKKWSAGKVREKLVNAVVMDQALYDKMLKEVPAYRLITPAVVSERMKVNGSVARRCINHERQGSDQARHGLLAPEDLPPCHRRRQGLSSVTRQAQKN